MTPPRHASGARRQGELPAHMRRKSLSYQLVIIQRVVVALALAAITAGTYVMASRAWTAGQVGVGQAQMLNQGQQIAGAAHSYLADHSADGPPSLKNLLKRDYLKKAPPGWTDSENFDAVFYPKTPLDVCTRVNEKAGLEPGKHMVLDVEDENTEQTGQFGCIVTTRTVFFKF